MSLPEDQEIDGVPSFAEFSPSDSPRSGVFSGENSLNPALQHGEVFIAPKMPVAVQGERRYILPENSLSKEFSLSISREAMLDDGPAGEPPVSQRLHSHRDYRYMISAELLPFELNLDLVGRREGRFSVESTRQLLLRIYDEQGNELLSSLDKVSLEPQLDYTLSAGQYLLRIEDAGGEEPENQFLLIHREY
jgi:hypothetical protein